MEADKFWYTDWAIADTGPGLASLLEVQKMGVVQVKYKFVHLALCQQPSPSPAL